ncbi:MAG: hypothetical protein U0R72_03970 [Nakamurella multipartita]
MNLTCVHTGWVFTRSTRNNAHANILAALQAGVQEIPFAVTGLDFDNGGEFLNRAVIKWAAEQDIYFTRSRPYKKNDQATRSSRRTTTWSAGTRSTTQYDTDEERHALNRLWKLVNDRLGYLTPTIKPVGWGENKAGRRKRLYDKPQTPVGRLLGRHCHRRKPTS